MEQLEKFTHICMTLSNPSFSGDMVIMKCTNSYYAFLLQSTIFRALYHLLNPQNATNYPQIGTGRIVVQL